MQLEAQPQDTGLEERLLQSSPLLEAFGNCRTCRNDNSSRFGKLVQLRLGSAGMLRSCSVRTYLLEKGRVTAHAADERNFHAFYQMLGGSTPQQKRELLLAESVDGWRCLRSSRATIAGVSEAERWLETIAALRATGMSGDQVDSILRILAGVLHLANIEFRGGDVATLSGDASLESACRLLDCRPADIRMATTCRRFRVGDEWITTQHSAREATEACAALCHNLYERLFSHLVSCINVALDDNRPSHPRLAPSTASPPSSPAPRTPPRSPFASCTGSAPGTPNEPPPKKVGAAAAPGDSYYVLDIFGFENFEHNSLEQLAINFANEKLQAHFNAEVFAAALDDYANEGISVGQIDYPDNGDAMRLLEARPLGVLSLLQEECLLGSGSDASLLQKLRTHHTASVAFKSSRRLADSFTVAHFAGDVRYATDGFLTKNKDPLNADLQLAMRESTAPLLRLLFAQSRAPPRGGGGRFRGLMHTFEVQLTSLLSLLSESHCAFVRCIKPNHAAAAATFETQAVLTQLRQSGVIEAVRISRVGYPIRLPFDLFLSEFHALVARSFVSRLSSARLATAPPETSRELCRSVVLAAGVDDRHVRVGIRKIFLSAEAYGELRVARRRVEMELAMVLQRGGRGMLARAAARVERKRRAEAERRRRKEEERLRRKLEEEARRLREEERRRAEEEARAEAARLQEAEEQRRREEEFERALEERVREAEVRLREEEQRRLAEEEAAERQRQREEADVARLQVEQRAASDREALEKERQARLAALHDGVVDEAGAEASANAQVSRFPTHLTSHTARRTLSIADRCTHARTTTPLGARSFHAVRASC